MQDHSIASRAAGRGGLSSRRVGLIPDVRRDIGRWEEDLWAWEFASASEAGCPYCLALLNKNTGELFRAEKPCGGVRCHRCGPQRAEAELLRLRACLRPYEQLYVAVCPWSKALALRLRVRRKRHHGHTVAILRRKEPDAPLRALIVATAGLAGTEAPRSFYAVPRWKAVAIAAATMRLPYWWGIKWSRGWGPQRNKTKRSQRWRSLGTYSDQHLQQAFEIAAARAHKQYDVRPQMGLPIPPPLTVDQWTDMLFAALSDARSAGPDVGSPTDV